MLTRLRSPLEQASPDAAEQYLTLLLIVLTFGTGVVDAASYVGLHQVFTANMTGNVIFIGLGIANHTGTTLVRSVIALGGFVVGATLAGRYLQRTPADIRVPDRVVHLLAAVTAILAVMTVVSAFWVPGRTGLDIATALFGGAMGVQAGAARRVAVAEVSTVVVTSTLASLVADSRLGGGSRTRQARRLAAVVAMGAGALVGALLLHVHIWVPLALATLVAGAVSYGLCAWSRQCQQMKPRVPDGLAQVGVPGA